MVALNPDLASLTQLCQFLESPVDARNPILSGLCLDSRKVVPGDVFIALAGGHTHGLHYAHQAVARGADAILWEHTAGMAVDPILASKLPCIAVSALSTRLAALAHHFYGKPSQAMQLIGVTGTDGKTSVTQFLAQLLATQAIRCGVMGTLGAGMPGKLDATGHTTPDVVTVHKVLNQLLSEDIRHVAMEVSSHALAQGRVDEVAFDIAVLTHLGRDHLDYHQTLEAYANAKARLFAWPKLKSVVLNTDDAFGLGLAKQISTSQSTDILAYGLAPNALACKQILGHSIRFLPDGLAFGIQSPWGEVQVSCPLFGRFNVYNVLAVVAASVQLGLDFSAITQTLHCLSTVPGRMERFTAPQRPVVVVDYAHTPMALSQALKALRKHGQGRLWCVFGCGGERDRGKRPLMAQAAQTYADKVMVTSDNPRREKPWAIIEDIRAGFESLDTVMFEIDRRQAIKLAIDQANPDDMVLIAGKGHETTQIIDDEILPFSDRECVLDLL